MVEMFSTFFLGFATSACALSLTLFATKKRDARPSLLVLALTVFCLAIAVSAASLGRPGENSIVQLWLALIRLDRPTVAAFAGGLGCGVLGAFALTLRKESKYQRIFSMVIFCLTTATLTLVVLKDVISPYLPASGSTGTTGGLFRASSVDGFRVEEVAELSFAPTCVEIGPDGNLYIAGFAGMAYQNGVIVRLKLNSSGPAKEVLVANYLNRPHGLAFYKGDLYVSRAGQFSRAVGGRIVQQNTGTITRLRDLNGDGRFDEYTDVVKDLPGAQQPDGLHQNNGIAFDTDGFLYITVGAPSDHGPSIHPYAGSILRSHPDGSDLKVFARGFRNPFGIAFGPDGELFATDNDSSADMGDEVNHIRKGRHYGHPYTSIDARTTVTGTVPPLLLCKSAQGLAFAPPKSLPRGFDNCLYVAAFGENAVVRITLHRSGDTYTAEKHFFASIPGVVDVAVANDGTIYAVSHYKKKVYRIIRK